MGRCLDDIVGGAYRILWEGLKSIVEGLKIYCGIVVNCLKEELKNIVEMVKIKLWEGLKVYRGRSLEHIMGWAK